jgi:hypothetical protein
LYRFAGGLARDRVEGLRQQRAVPDKQQCARRRIGRRRVGCEKTVAVAGREIAHEHARVLSSRSLRVVENMPAVGKKEREAV